MDYKKKYIEALKRAKRMFSEKELNYLFPEFAESEDEKIRKELIHLFNDTIWNDSLSQFYNLDKQKVIAWLEKQGEQKPTDKVEPKFHKS